MTNRKPVNAQPLGATRGAATDIVAPQFSGPTILTLPCPPSANRAFKNVRNRKGRGRALTQEAKDWHAYARRELAAQNPGMIESRVLIVLNIDRASMSADADNRIKLLFDLLVKGGVLKDDKYITGFAAAWAEPRARMVRLAIFPVQTLSIDFHPSAKHDGACGGWFFNAPSSQEEEEAA